jgi:anti-sigma regulatory factor (Ser/Thr protein kinase)
MIAVDLQIDATDSTAEIVADFVTALAREALLPRNKAYWLRLATEEIITNIAQHGYRGPGPVWLKSGFGPDRVWVQIEDAAPEFDPRTHDPGSKVATELATREAGGYGLLLALRVADEFRYERVRGRNRNTLYVSRPDDGANQNPAG